MSFISYAQNFEDVRLWRAFSGIQAGRYIDIGAQDPVRDSVSLAFHQRGWRGVHIEPTRAFADALRKARPTDTVIEAAVSNAPGPIRLFEIPTTGLSTGISAIAQRHASVGWTFEEVVVPTVTLHGVFELFGPELVHWLKIDVEGMEADVLASWGNHPARPAVLLIEATLPLTQTRTDCSWRALVLERGYREVAFDGLSAFFLHKDHKQLRHLIAASPNVFDGFHVSKTHFSAGHLVADKDNAVSAITSEMLSHNQAEKDAATMQIARAQAESEAAHTRLAEVEDLLAEANQRVLVTQNELARINNELKEASFRAATAETQLADAAGRIDSLQRERGSLLREAGHLEGQLSAVLQAHAERVADAVSIRSKLEEKLELAEQNWRAVTANEAAVRASLSADLANARSELGKLNGVKKDLERQFHLAAGLLSSTPDIFAGLSHLRTWLIRQLLPSAAIQATASHQASIMRFRVDSRPDAASVMGGQSELPANTHNPIMNSGSNQRDYDMVESDEPITSVPRLLEPPDRHFIEAAYKAVLGRTPDPEGEQHFLTRLRGGAHKLEVLSHLRRSPEGRSIEHGVVGLDRAINRYRLATMPILGALIRIITDAEGNGATHRHLRILANEMGRMRTDQLKLEHLIQRIAERAETNHWLKSAALPPSTPKAATLPKRPQIDPVAPRRADERESEVFDYLISRLEAVS